MNLPYLGMLGARSRRWSQRLAWATGAIAVTALAWSSPSWAGDPFGRAEPHDIDDATAAAFVAIFERGNYVEAATYLEAADDDEPMAHAMRASYAFLNGEIGDMADYAEATRTSGEALIDGDDPLRGHLYTAMGLLMEGAAIFLEDGAVAGTPAIFSRLPQVYRHLEQAEDIDPNDPELNLVWGYLDLLLAVNLPFSNPDMAIARLENYAQPEYISQRGIAVGQRDLRNQGEAMAAVDRALALAPNNPELMYLKAQIFVLQGDNAGSLPWFQQATALEAQLPQSLANQIAYEGCRAERRVTQADVSCSPLLEREAADTVADAEL